MADPVQYERYEGGSAEAERLLFERLRAGIVRVQQKNQRAAWPCASTRRRTRAMTCCCSTHRPRTPPTPGSSWPGPVPAAPPGQPRRYARTPVENASVEWPEDIAPPVPVAVLTIYEASSAARLGRHSSV